MIKLGIAVYPHRSNEAEIKHQLDLAIKYHFSEIYTTIQSDEAWEDGKLNPSYLKLFQFSHTHGLTIHLDVNHDILQRLNASPDNLSVFPNMHVHIIRLDFGFENHEYVAALTKNTDGVLIEDNASMQDNPIARIKAIQHKGNMDNYITCHNFFPRPDTGLSFQHTQDKTKLFKACGIKTGIFINSLDSKSVLFDQGHGLCTVENHRYKPSFLCASEIIATNLYDTIFFGDVTPSEIEMKIVSDLVQNNYVLVPLYFNTQVPPELKKLLLETTFISRSDQPENVVRATQLRNCMKIEPLRCVNREKLCLTIDNNLAGRYVGEIQIVTKILPSASYINVIGQVDMLAENLVEQIKYGRIPFKLIEE